MSVLPRLSASRLSSLGVCDSRDLANLGVLDHVAGLPRGIDRK